ncbi:hypothetical protein SESBI_46292 [Sesbania bispinosa]|nr:hypothetical protein SESBI_46292 [Sesbania bispinosa]
MTSLARFGFHILRQLSTWSLNHCSALLPSVGVVERLECKKRRVGGGKLASKTTPHVSSHPLHRVQHSCKAEAREPALHLGPFVLPSPHYLDVVPEGKVAATIQKLKQHVDGKSSIFGRVIVSLGSIILHLRPHREMISTLTVKELCAFPSAQRRRRE